MQFNFVEKFKCLNSLSFCTQHTLEYISPESLNTSAAFNLPHITAGITVNGMKHFRCHKMSSSVSFHRLSFTAFLI
jgi:hypothetical protein